MSAAPSAPGKSHAWSVLLVIGLSLLLAIAVSRLFSLRFARGDIFPPYSSLRTDPLGTKALADSIHGLPGFSVERSYRQLSRLKVRQPATIAYLGIDYRAPIDEKEFAEAERMVRDGARLIIAFAPELSRKASATPPVPVGTPVPGSTPATPAPATPAPAATPTPATTPNPTPARRSKFGIEEETLFDEAAKGWDVSFDRAEGTKQEVLHAKAEPAEGENDLDASVPWHTALFFKDLDPAWRTLYRSNGESVVIERSLGSGSIVLCSDSYFLSNEGLHTSRAPKLVARMVGPPRTIVFDEFHNGVAENSNISGLARKYGLGGTILALFGVAALFIWKNAIPFLPSQKSPSESDAHVLGLDAGAGFINLLRRGVPANRILAVCIEEWKKSRGSRIREEEHAHVDSVLRAHEGRSATKDAAAAYRVIASGLNRR